MDWRTFKIGDELIWFGEEFDGSWSIPCKVSYIGDDHALAKCDDGETLYIDDWNIHSFKRK